MVLLLYSISEYYYHRLTLPLYSSFKQKNWRLHATDDALIVNIRKISELVIFLRNIFDNIIWPPMERCLRYA